MSTQIAVRLPDELVAFLDRVVAAGEPPSRAAIDNTLTVPTHLVGRTIGYLTGDQEAALARAVVLAFNLDLPLLG